MAVSAKLQGKLSGPESFCMGGQVEEQETNSVTERLPDTR